MKILITGATGLLGTHAVRRFSEAGHSIKALCRNANVALFKDLPNVEIVEGNVLDILRLEQLLEGCEVVLHTAAMVSFSPKEREQMYKTNVEGTANIVNACLHLGIKKLCFVSSVAAVGRPSNNHESQEAIVVAETQKWEDSPLNSHYAQSKYQAECEVWRGEAEGLEVAVVNPSVILGEADWNRSSTQLFKYVFEKNKFYTAGYLNYVDVGDVVEALLLLAEGNTNGERFILSAGSISYKAFFEKIAEEFQKPKPSILVGKTLSAIIWRVEALRSWLTGSSPLITKETAKSAQTHIVFDGTKITKTIPFHYTPLEKSIERVCRFFDEKA